jgi:glycosyltransferase EpsD
MRKKALYTATVDLHILSFHLPYLKMLQEMGYEVHVATNGTAEIPHCDVRHTVSFARSPFKPGNIRAIGQLRKIIDKEQFDLIHTHTPMGGVVTRLAAKGARKRGTKVIYTAHGFHFYKGAPWHYWALFYPIEKYLARYTDVLITINQEDYDRAKRKFKTRVEYVPGVGIDPKKFDFPFSAADKLKLRKSLGLNKDDFVMVFPAELNKNKNQILLINAMAQLVPKHPNIHLLLPGKDNLNGKYQKIVKTRGLEKNIHFLGYRTDIPKLLKISDLAVSSSLREGLPVNLLEAKYLGITTVATNCRGNGDVADEIISYSEDQAVLTISEVYKKKSGAKDNLGNKFIQFMVLSQIKELYVVGNE